MCRAKSASASRTAAVAAIMSALVLLVSCGEDGSPRRSYEDLLQDVGAPGPLMFLERDPERGDGLDILLILWPGGEAFYAVRSSKSGMQWQRLGGWQDEGDSLALTWEYLQVKKSGTVIGALPLVPPTRTQLWPRGGGRLRAATGARTRYLVAKAKSLPRGVLMNRSPPQTLPNEKLREIP